MADVYGRAQLDADPLADAVAAVLAEQPQTRELVELALTRGIDAVPHAPVALRRLFDSLETPPHWARFARMELGARTYQRIGMAQMLILSAWSLMNGYHCAPAIKPLAFTGQLEKKAPRRLAETSRFVTETTQCGGMRRYASGFAMTVQVRLMHATVRRMLLASGSWDLPAWGAPINQADMVGTIVEFSLLVLAGARKMGFVFAAREAEALIHLWRYIGWVMGVDERLLVYLADEDTGVRFAELIDLVQPGPDEDSRALAAALRRVPLQMAASPFEKQLSQVTMRYHDGLTRAFNGDRFADELGIPNRAWKYAIYPTRALVTPLECVRRVVPGATHLAALVGNRMVRSDVRRMLGGIEPSFRALRARSRR